MGRALNPITWEVQTYCEVHKSPLDCDITFSHNSSVQKFGHFKRGQIPTNPDFAGLGVLLAFIVPIILLGLYSICVACANIEQLWSKTNSRRPWLGAIQTVLGPQGTPHDKGSNPFRTLALGISDSQSLLSIAYSFNFVLEGRCTLSEYHYNIGVDSILLALTAAVMSVLMVQDYWKSPLAGALRICAHLTVFILLVLIMLDQLARPTFPEWEPSFNKTDSAILMPVSCFLDPDLDSFMFRKSSAQLDHMGWPYAPKRYSVEFNLWVLTLVLYLLALCRYVVPRGYQLYTGRGRGSPNQNQHGWPILSFLTFYWLFCTVSVLTVMVLLTRHIIVLKLWTSWSGWLQLTSDGHNPENDIRGLGQLAPLFALGCILISIADRIQSWVPWGMEPTEVDSLEKRLLANGND